MANTKVKNMKKKDWQELAKSHGIEFTPKNEVRYLVEKIAEKIGINDDIVKLDHLKQAVYEKLNAPVSETKVEVTPTIEEVAPTLSRIDELRAECTTLGLAYNEIHTENDLEQLLSAIRGTVAPVTNAPIETSTDFELKADNFEEVVSNAPNPSTINHGNVTNNIMENISPAPLVQNISVNGELEKFRILFTQTIRSHFRLLTVNEINDMIKRDRYPFTHTIIVNPNQGNQVEIIFSSGNSSVRLPSEDRNDWISING
jgi:hypothetical protein